MKTVDLEELKNFSEDQYRDLLGHDKPPETNGILNIKIGGKVIMAGVELKVHHVNTGKRRITLVPVSQDIKVKEA